MQENENQNIPLAPLPDLPSEEDARQQRMDEIRPYLLDATRNYPEPFYTLEYKGVPMAPLGGIQAISGQKKNGKTFLVVQLMAALLGVNSERVKKYLPGLRVPERTLEHLGHLPKVLWVDTEMEELNSAKVLRRVHWLCDVQMDKPFERFNVLWLRSVADTKDANGGVIEKAHAKRYRIIKNTIDILEPDVVFIDGIRDIIGDFNDVESSSSLVLDLMSIAQERGICIWNTLHMNPRPRNDDESKMRGHLGTELGNKITDTLVSIKHKQDGQVWFTVKQDDARDKDLEDWEFIVNDAAGSLGIPQIKSTLTADEQEEAQLQQARIEADDYFKLYHWTSTGATYTDIDKFLKQKGVTSNRKRVSIIDTAMEAGIIYKSSRKYYYSGLNKEIPNDQSESLPFAPPEDDQENE